MSLISGFAAVNQAAEAGGGEQRQLTLEAQEARAITAWEQTLALIAGQRDEEAQAALRALLDDPAVDGCATDQLHRIKFLSLRNLAELLARRGAAAAPEALAVYCQATEVVDDDAVLWSKLGTLAAEAGYWAAARSAFELGLELDPQHPTMADKLLQLLLHVGDAGAAASLANAMLRRNPRHVAAAAVAAEARQGVALTSALRGGLLQLAPLQAVPAQAQQPLGWAWQYSSTERPRTLEQPTWQQLLHHSLLFLSSNRVVESSSSAAGAAASPAGEHHAHKVPSLVRFNIKRAQPPQQAQQAQVQQQRQQAADQPLQQAAGPQQEAQEETQAPQQAQPEAGSADSPQAQQLAAAPPAEAADSAAAAGAAPAAPAGTQPTTPSVPAAPTGDVTAGAGAAAMLPTAAPIAPTPAAAAEPDTSTVQPSGAGLGCAPGETVVEIAEEGEEEEQEQRHPNGSGAIGGRKQEGRATRSRAATGRGLPLVPAARAAEGQHSAEDDAADLLSTLGSLLSVPQLPPGTPLVAPSPLLCSPASRAAAGADAAKEGQQPGADVAAAGQEEEAAVKAFLRRLPPAGVGRHELAVQLLGTLGTASAAAQLSSAVRYQLLQVAHQMQHSVAHLPPTHCLVLGELFTDAAAAAAEAGKQRLGGSLTLGGQNGAAPAAPKPSGADTSPQAPSVRASGVARRPSGRAKRLELSTVALQQSARLWLSRYRLAAAEQTPSSAVLQAGPAAVAAAQELPAGMVRYWWATGRLLESEGDMVAARAAYATCEQGLPMLPGNRSISLPHCQAGSTISGAALLSKREALQLHSVLEGAQRSAAAGDHSAAVATLAPVLLCCSDKEQQMLQLDQQQWLRGMQRLLGSAGATGAWSLALRCHLRLLNALLPQVPPQAQALVRGSEQQISGGALLPALLPTVEQLAQQQPTLAALDAAAYFLHQHGAQLLLSARGGSSGSSRDGSDISSGSKPASPVVLHPMEVAMFEAVQHQLATVLASCSAALAAAGAAAAHSHLNLKINKEREAMCDAATALWHLSSLAVASRDAAAFAGANPLEAQLQPVEQAQELAWLLCDTLGSAQALMERHGRFVQACLSELRRQLARLEPLRRQQAAGAAASSNAAAADEGGYDAEELHAALTTGLQHCLLWLYGLELPGLEKQEAWGGDYQDKGPGDAAARQLTSPAAVAEVWPLVEPHLMEDLQHITKYRGFLLAAAAQFPAPPPSVAQRSAAAWRQLAAAEPPMLPCAELDGAGSSSAAAADPMQRLLQLAGVRSGGQGQLAGDNPAEPMAVDGEGVEPDAAAAQRAADAPGLSDEDGERFAAVTSSIFYLLSVLQDAEESGTRSLLGEGAECGLEAQLQAVKWDVALCPGRLASWERLAADYHTAADDLLNEASKVRTHLEWKYDPVLQRRAKHWRRLAFWASLGAWLTAESDEDRARLLVGTSSRLLEDALRTLPCQDPMADDNAWRAAKADPARMEGLHLALAGFQASWELAAQAEARAEEWEVLLAQARCMRKLGQAPELWLPLLARACHAAAVDGGVLLPLYKLHAARMRLLLAMPSARRWASSIGTARPSSRSGQREEAGLAQQRALLRLVGACCFLPSMANELDSHAGLLGSDAAGTEEPAANGLRELWNGLLGDCCAAMQWVQNKDQSFHRAAHRLAAAMQQVGEAGEAAAALLPFFTKAKHAFFPGLQPIKDSTVASGTRRRGRQAKASKQAQQAEGGAEAMAPAAAAAVPERRWGEEPVRLSSVGLEEDEAHFGTRLRKTLRLYFACLSDAAMASEGGAQQGEAGQPLPLDALQAAAAYLVSPPTATKAWEGSGKLARGHYLLALAASLRACCPLEQLQAVPLPEPPSTARPAAAQAPPAADAEVAAAAMQADEACGGDPQKLGPEPVAHNTPGAALRAPVVTFAAPATGAVPSSAAPGTGIHATPADGLAAAPRSAGPWRVLPTPATQARQQQSAHLLRLVAQLDAAAVEPLLAKAHQVYAECSLHAGDEDKWRSEAASAMQAAQSIGGCQLSLDAELEQLWKQPEVLRRIFSLYANLYVHLLQWQGEADKLLQLLLAMKKRVRMNGSAEPRQARLLRRHARLLAETLLATLEAGLDSLELDGASARAAQQAQQAQQQQAQHPAPLDAGASAMEAETTAAPQQAPLAQAAVAQLEPAAQVQGSPAAASAQQEAAVGVAQPAAGAGSASPPPADNALAAAQTPAAAAGAGGGRSTTPGTDLRAVLGTPAGPLPFAEQSQLQERGMALLQVAYAFHKDIPRWLLVPGASAPSNSSSSVRDELRAVVRSGEHEVLRAFKLYASCSGAAVPGSRGEVLKAAEEAIKQQRRQSRQQLAAGRQQGAAAGPAAGLLPAISEAGEEAAHPRPAAGGGGRKRGGAAAGNAPPRSTRKRARLGSADLGPQAEPAAEAEEGKEDAVSEGTGKQAEGQAPQAQQDAAAAQVESLVQDVVEHAVAASS